MAMTPDEMRDWLLAEAEKEGQQYQEAKRRRLGKHLEITHHARVDMIVRVLFMTDLADQQVTSALAHRWLGNDDLNPEAAAGDAEQ